MRALAGPGAQGDLLNTNLDVNVRHRCSHIMCSRASGAKSPFSHGAVCYVFTCTLYLFISRPGREDFHRYGPRMKEVILLSQVRKLIVEE